MSQTFSKVSPESSGYSSQPQQHPNYQNGTSTPVENGQYSNQHSAEIKQEQPGHMYQQPAANGHNSYGNGN